MKNRISGFPPWAPSGLIQDTSGSFSTPADNTKIQGIDKQVKQTGVRKVTMYFSFS